MVHQWKLTKNEGLKLIHKTIRECLIESNYTLELNELVSQINEKTKMNHIHHSKKYNRLSKYIKCEHEGVIKFIDSHSIYGISYINNRIIVHLLNGSDFMNVPKNITNADEWIIL